jgi:hypothetical protein
MVNYVDCVRQFWNMRVKYLECLNLLGKQHGCSARIYDVKIHLEKKKSNGGYYNVHWIRRGGWVHIYKHSITDQY